VQVAQWLADEGIDLLELSGGTYQSMALMGLAEEQVRPDAPEAYFLDVAERVRAAASVPLMLTGGLRTTATMRALVARGTVDVVGLARPLCLDADLPRRILEGAVERAPSDDRRTGVRVVDGMVEAGWYGEQIARLADGHRPDARLARWRGLSTYLGAEAWHSTIRRAPRLA